MNYEQKYKQLHKFISDLYPYMSEYCKEKVEGFIPEIKEIRRGDTREELISFLEELSKLGRNTNFDKWTTFDCAKWIEWVKKQDPTWFEEELEKAYKCADEVQYLKGYNDAKYEFEKQGKKPDYNPYKATVESIATMVEKYANTDDLKDFYDNIKVKCKDAVEYDNNWIEKQGDKKHSKAEQICSSMR